MPSDRPARPAVPLDEGSIVGGAYRVIRAIAEGGMGTVYEVEQQTTGARRALKAMHVQLARDAALRARFVREARVSATIKSDHVASIVDAGVDETTGVPYLVMELLDGRTLASELRKRGSFTWSEGHEILRQLCHALAAAHDARVVHRDVKPANVFLCASRTAGMPFVVKVLDFGIAKVLAEVQAGGDIPTAVIGTPSWMAPEQTEEDASIGPQADVWALGLVAFSIFVGRHYWPSANSRGTPTAAVMRDMILSEIVPASARAASYERAGALPDGFDDWFARCVARDPAQRFADARVAWEAFAAMMKPVVADAPAPSFRAIPLAPSVPPPPNAPDTRPRTDDSATVAQGAVSRSRFTKPGPRTEPEPSAASRWALPIVVVASAAAVVAFAVATKQRDEPPIPALTSEPPVAAATAAVVPAPKIVARLHGSNTLGAQLAPALAEAFLRKRSANARVLRRKTGEDELRVEVLGAGDVATEVIEIHAHGSSTGFADMRSGACDVGMSSRRIKDDERDALGGVAPAASEYVVALDGLAVIVNPASRVAKLSTAQVHKAFTGEVGKWSELGGASAPIALYARDEKSGTFDSFKATVLGGSPLSASAKRFESSDQLSDAVAADPNGIGFVGLAYVRSARPLLIQDTKGAAFVPSPTTIATEEYPLSRRLYLYLRAGASEEARAFVDFVLSEDGQSEVEKAGFVDLRPRCITGEGACESCAAAYRQAVAGACRLTMNVRVDESTHQLDARALRDLGRLGALLAKPEYAGRSLVVLGFSDAGADAATRSLDRANVVAEQLRARGVRVGLVKGLGAAMPIGDDAEASGRERNRRVELWLR